MGSFRLPLFAAARTAVVLPVTIFLMSASFSSCSVKEAREDCPCYAFVNLGDFISSGFSMALVSFSSDRLVNRAEVELSSYDGRLYEQMMPRRLNRVSVAAGICNSMVRGDTLFARRGIEADPVWLYTAMVPCDDDRIYLDALPCKQFCKLTILVPGLSPQEEYPLSFKVEAACSGLDIYSRLPVEGEYCAVAQKIAPGVYCVRVPRQNDGKLMLDAFVPDDDSSADGQTVYSKDIGDLLSSGGYDWSAENLRDVVISIDRTSFEISLFIAGWDIDDIYDDQEI